MLRRIFNSAATIPLASLLILLGLASFLAGGTTLTVQFFHFMKSGHDITVPNETITLDVVPSTQYAIYHRVTGSHITENRPPAEIPETIEINLTNASSGDPIEMTTVNWYMNTSFFGLRTRRQAIRQFSSPDTETISLQVAGLDAETVFYVGRTHRVFNENDLPMYLAWLIASLLLVVIAAGLILNRMIRTTPELSIRNELL
jgi:hypothetical protein